jgi:hypothetical protein
MSAAIYDLPDDATNYHGRDAGNDLNRRCTHVKPPLENADLPSLGNKLQEQY